MNSISQILPQAIDYSIDWRLLNGMPDYVEIINATNKFASSNYLLLNQLERRINSFAFLEKNWDSYNADKISKESIRMAIKILYDMNNDGGLAGGIIINVFPMRNGGIQFEFDGSNLCAELEIKPEGGMEFILYDNEGNPTENMQVFEFSEFSNLLVERK